MSGRKAVDYVQKFKGPIATVYGCPFCKHMTRIPKSRPGDRVGRGYGLRTGGPAFHQMAAHIRKEHPERVDD